MTYDRLATIRREADAFARAAGRGFAPRVPGCPDWTVGDLVFHLGCVHRFHTAHLVRGVTTPPPERQEPDPPDEELLAWFEDGVDALLDALTRTDPDLPAWNWAPHTPQVASFWSRRMALETAVHRWDAESAHGEPGGFDLAVAVDAVDEMLTVHAVAEPPPDLPTGTVVVRATDAGRTWAVRMAAGTIDVLEAAPDKPDAALEGAASDLLLALWGRVSAPTLSATGDPLLIAVLLD